MRVEKTGSTKGEEEMNQKKRENYKLKASIHTANVKFKSNDQLTGDEINMEVGNVRVSHDQDKPHTAIVNLNKTNKGDLFSFNEYKNTFVELMNSLKVKDYYFNRVDLRLDSYDSEHYQMFTKLNRYLICLIAVTYKSKNNYRTLDLFSENQISVAIKNRDIEIEHYNRAVKSQITGNTSEQAQSRLELRSKARTGDTWQLDDIEGLFVNKWIERLEKSLKNTDKLIDVINTNLVKQYNEEHKKLDEFISSNCHRIYSSSQLINLLVRLGVPNPIKKAYKLKNRHKIEYISKSDVRFAIKEIKRALKEYFSN